ncbi:hypothetical protein [Aquimarina agarilytica]|uniref:hypothetical protein n=1 Tax=Aquimarina agarilytica TaxID=1087449 RepID=UPI00028A00BF|nr:hypothetical protein [Aquimarina agarilytica]
MSKYILSLVLIPLCFINCKKKADNSLIYSTEKNEIEEIEIELPQLLKWTESYSNSEIKRRFDAEAQDGTKILGVYIPNEIAQINVDSLEYIDFDNYSIFFIRNHEQKWKIKNNDMQRIFNIHLDKANVEMLDIDETIKKAHKDSTFIKPEKFYFLRDYKSHDNAYTAIQIIKPFLNDHNDIKVYAYNIINIKNHLVYGGYYLDFKGKKSIHKAIKNNELIISKFIDKNLK